MNRILLSVGGLLTFSLALFKIAMPYLFHWRGVMGSSATSLWATLYGENLGISLIILFFAYISIFLWRDLLMTGLGRTIILSIVALWVFRAAAELMLYKIGVDGAWWRFILFLGLAVVYMLPLITTRMTSPEQWKTQIAP